MKVVTLCLLVTGHGGQTVWLMDVRNLTISKEQVPCRIGDPIKTSKPGSYTEEIVLDGFLLRGNSGGKIPQSISATNKTT